MRPSSSLAPSLSALLSSACPSAPLLATAPMVAHSKLAFRSLTFGHGANLAFTPMMQAKHFVRS